MSSRKINARQMEINEEFYVCPECGYDKGFHNAFRVGAKQNGHLELFLICPNCAQKFDLGLAVLLKSQEP